MSSQRSEAHLMGATAPPSVPLSGRCPNCGFASIHDGVCDRCKYSIEQSCESKTMRLTWELLRIEYGDDNADGIVDAVEESDN